MDFGEVKTSKRREKVEIDEGLDKCKIQKGYQPYGSAGSTASTDPGSPSTH